MTLYWWQLLGYISAGQDWYLNWLLTTGRAARYPNWGSIVEAVAPKWSELERAMGQATDTQPSETPDV